MFTSRTFVVFLIPIIILGLAIWFVATADIDRGDVEVAGALVGRAEMELSVTSSYLAERGGARRLAVEIKCRNVGSYEAHMHPKNFKLVLAKSDDPAGSVSPRSVFNPMQYTSTSAETPNSVSLIRPGTSRSIALVFYGETMPRGDEWEDHLLSLEYYDEAAPLMLSKLLNPTEE